MNRPQTGFALRRTLLLKLKALIVEIDQAGLADTLGFDLDGVLEHYERQWKIEVTK